MNLENKPCESCREIMYKVDYRRRFCDKCNEKKKTNPIKELKSKIKELIKNDECTITRCPLKANLENLTKK